MSLEHRNGPGVQECRRDGPALDGLGVALHRASAEAGDLLQCSFQGTRGHPSPAVCLVDEEAGDPPIRSLAGLLEVGALVLDARKLVGGSELTPADAVRVLVDERGVGAALANSALLGGSVPFRRPRAIGALRVEGDAPAAAPDAVVLLDEPGEVRPGRLVQRLNAEAGHAGRTLSRTRAEPGAAMLRLSTCDANPADIRPVPRRLPSVAGAASTRPQAAAIGHPTSPAKIVLRISSGGGFVTPQTNLRALPSFTLYGDGTVIVPGVITQMYPGPAIYPLIRSKLRESQVQALLRSAAHAGLLARGPIDYGTVGVTDMPTTTVLLNAGGRQVSARPTRWARPAARRFRPGRPRRARLSRGSSPAFRTVCPARAMSRGRSPSTSHPPTARRSPAPPRSCGR